MIAYCVTHWDLFVIEIGREMRWMVVTLLSVFQGGDAAWSRLSVAQLMLLCIVDRCTAVEVAMTG